jgi:glycosyltransferase involved in cell wall biosynthesis
VRVAFVAPFYGARAAGGAEAECRQTAIRLAAAGIEVDVLTTCLLDLHHDWNVNYHRQGAATEDGVRVHRFFAQVADLRPFARLNARLLAGETLTAADERQFMALHVNSPALYRHLAAAHRDYDWIVFIPYPYGTTCHGSRLCPEQTVLIPCLHDEPYARLAPVRELFRRAARLVFHTRAEQALAGRLYGPLPGRSLLVGEGVATGFPADGARFCRRYNMARPFVLYAGRKDASKNVPALVRWFHAYARRHRGGDLRLVLIGPESVPLPAGNEILDLGFLPEQDKRDAYAAATVFCQLSLNESFSIVMMEAWACGTPCLVHGDCAVTREHVVESGGGLYCRDGAEFAGCLDHLLARPDLARRMGEWGRRYVQERFGWDAVIRRYREEVFAR